MAFLTSIPNILLIILGFGVLIFIHELGHFLAAKWAGIRTEAFAVGMGPVAFAWRKGIGLRFGSTAKATEDRVHEYLKREADVSIQFKEQSTEIKISPEQRKRAEVALGLGETEYSLRWLPIGGFVKMLGQEDTNPNYVSDDARSYNMCPVGKRMIVVSAGVIMNLLLAVVLFVVAFTFGVTFPAPVVGSVSPTSPAAIAVADNAKSAGVTVPGIHPGDRVIQTDDDIAQTFADLQIASAMANPNRPVRMLVQRDGVAEPLLFTLLPQKDPISGLLSFGIAPGSSNTLMSPGDEGEAQLNVMLRQTGLDKAGVTAGMKIVSAAGTPVSTFQQMAQAIEAAAGQAVTTEWTALDRRGEAIGSRVNASVSADPDYQALFYPTPSPDGVMDYEQGVFGLVPLVKIKEILSDSRNRDVLREGDVILRIGDLEAPRFREFLTFVQKQPAGPVPMRVLRDGQEVAVTATVVRKGLVNSTGMLNIVMGLAWETPMTASPMDRVTVINEQAEKSAGGKPNQSIEPTAIANLRLLGGDRIVSVGGDAISNWAGLREQLRAKTAAALASHSGAEVELTVEHPTAGHPQERTKLVLDADDVKALHALGWHSPIPGEYFEPINTVLTSGGNPLKAIAMGFKETKKTVLLTYLTLDRLFRGSVGISQLRGPVGIVHIGTKVADRGFLYILFFLGMISVNLAVINFLPMPIVDGGLFLFLIYEKFKGKPPPLAFQNAATIVGICMIGALFLITFYNDVMRLLG